MTAVWIYLGLIMCVDWNTLLLRGFSKGSNEDLRRELVEFSLSLKVFEQNPAAREGLETNVARQLWLMRVGSTDRKT